MTDQKQTHILKHHNVSEHRTENPQVAWPQEVANCRMTPSAFGARPLAGHSSRVVGKLSPGLLGSISTVSNGASKG